MYNSIIETERLYLRNFQGADFAAVHEYGSLPDFSQYEMWGPNTEPHSRAFIEESIAKAKYQPRYQYQLAIIFKETDELIGGANIELESQNSKIAHIGYAVNPRFQNKGYATEASKSLIRFGFADLNLLIIYATCDTRNVASYTVLEKCGMRRVGKIIGNRKIRNGIYDTYRYEIYPGNN